MASKQKTYRERIACINWNEEAPMTIGVRSFRIERKVKTKGVKVIFADFSKLISHLRNGYEVRLANNSDDSAQLRLFPVVLKDMKTVVVAAQVMHGSQLRNALSDKKVTLLRQKQDGIQTLSAAKKVSDKVNKARREMVCVTPDMMVKCPKCGTNFRVGKYLSENK